MGRHRVIDHTKCWCQDGPIDWTARQHMLDGTTDHGLNRATQREVVATMTLRGRTAQEIGQAIGVSARQVQRIRRQIGISQPVGGMNLARRLRG